jgi:ferric-dicitrate binding protein FerR (iron transport regulator)
MEDNSTYYIDLITRYFSNETTGNENEILAGWLKTDPENLKLFREYQKTWEIFAKAKIDQIDVEEAWGKLDEKISELKGSPDLILQRTIETRVHGKNFRHIFVNRTLHLHYQRALKIAAVFVLILVPSFLFIRYLLQPESRQLNASTGIIESRLPDGTSVTLNTGSLLEYPSRFSGSKREVILTGEAWFEVAHDRTKPFIISNGKVRIEVLGTSFYVNTINPGDNIEVILSSGKVAIYYNDRPSEQALLAPGDKAEVMKDQEMISKSSNDNENFLSWKTKIFVFNDDPLSDIVRDLNKVYHANLKITNHSAASCRITATFNNQSLESILNVLKSTVNITIRNNGTEIEISGNGCN